MADKKFSPNNPYKSKDQFQIPAMEDPIRYWSWVMQNPEKTEEDRQFGRKWLKEKGYKISEKELMKPLPLY